MPRVQVALRQCVKRTVVSHEEPAAATSVLGLPSRLTRLSATPRAIRRDVHTTTKRLCYCATVPLCYYATTLLYYSATLYSATGLLYYCTTLLLYPSATTVLCARLLAPRDVTYYTTNILLCYCTTTLLYYYSTTLPYASSCQETQPTILLIYY